jgi:serine/threonine protein kinase
VLYEMLTGRVPFDGDSLIDVALHHVQDEPIPLSRLRPDISSATETAVVTALAKNPAESVCSCERSPCRARGPNRRYRTPPDTRSRGGTGSARCPAYPGDGQHREVEQHRQPGRLHSWSSPARPSGGAPAPMVDPRGTGAALGTRGRSTRHACTFIRWPGRFSRSHSIQIRWELRPSCCAPGWSGGHGDPLHRAPANSSPCHHCDKSVARSRADRGPGSRASGGNYRSDVQREFRLTGCKQS